MSLSNLSISLDVLDADLCRDIFSKVLHPSGPTCHKCKVSFDGHKAETFRSGKKVKCHSCGTWVRLRSGTVLENTSADWCQLVMLVAMTNENCTAHDIAKACRISEDSVYRYQSRLKDLM